MAALAGVAALGGGAIFFYDVLDFRARQGEMLSGYVPEAKCGTATFTVVEREDAIQDWRYVVRVSDSDACTKSLRAALVTRGATQSSVALLPGLLLPGHTDTEHEAVAFDFDSEPGAIIWTRDKT